MQFLKDKEHSKKLYNQAYGDESANVMTGPNIYTPKMMDDDMMFDDNDGENIFKNQQHMNELDPAQTEMLAAGLNYMRYEQTGWHGYWCVACLLLITLSNALQRSCIQYMWQYYSTDPDKAKDPAFYIQDQVSGFDVEAYNLLVGDYMALLYALMVLLTGSISDFCDRKLLLCGACFGWTLCTYLSSFATNFHQLLVLKIIINFCSAF